MDIQSYIKPELLILILACWGLGLVLKSITSLKNQFIPAILCAFCVVMATLWVFAQGGDNAMMAIFTGIIQGLIVFATEWTIYEKGIRNIGVATESQGGGDQ